MIDTYYVQGIKNEEDVVAVETALNALPHIIECVIDPESKEITFTVTEFVDLDELNTVLQQIGNYKITKELPIPKARVAKGNRHTEAIKTYSLKDFIPLISIFSLIIAFTIVRQWCYGFCPVSAMIDFMGSFFIVFGAFKLMNVHGFVEAYQVYDLIAQRSKAYAYAYPFIEVGLGFAYFMRWNLYWINLATLIIMLVSAAGVANELRKGKTIMCACLGVVFKIPMTYVTLLEDLLMAVMALIMLLF